MSDFAVTIADGPSRDERTVTVGTTLADLFAGDRSVVAARLTDPAGTRLVDLATLAKAGDLVEPVAADSEDGRAIIRHSTAHVLAQAVQQAFPEAKLGIGPPIRNGFYYDFDVGAAVHAGGPEGPREAGCRRSSSRGSCSPGARSPTRTRARSWPPSRTSWS